MAKKPAMPKKMGKGGGAYGAGPAKKLGMK